MTVPPKRNRIPIVPKQEIAERCEALEKLAIVAMVDTIVNPSRGWYFSKQELITVSTAAVDSRGTSRAHAYKVASSIHLVHAEGAAGRWVHETCEGESSI